MAQRFILLSVLWLVVAIFATSTRASDYETYAETTATTDDSTPATTDDSTPATTDDSTPATTDDSTPATTDDSTTATPTTPFKDHCNPNPCGAGSTCQERFDTYVCLCLAGDFYNNDSKICEHSKAFPGKLQLPTEPYDVSMKDHKSEAFINTADKITAELKRIFEKSPPDYSGSVVLELLELKPNRIVESRNDNGVTASVQISFSANSPITESDVKETIENNKDCGDCVLKGGTFVATDLCASKPCDEESTNCISSDGSYECICKEGYMKSEYSTRMCIACPSGEELKDNECVTCSFGYSGFNCSEKWKLILVIVGSVLGGLLLIALILLPVVATQKSMKSSKKHKSPEMEKPHTNHSFGSQPTASNKFGHSQGVPFNKSASGHSGFQNAGVSVFPRAANPTNGWDNRTNMEMNPSNGRQNFGHMNSGSRVYDEPEDMRPYARPQSNPYAQSQPKVNPYTQNQGHSNPYYTHDDGRRY